MTTAAEYRKQARRWEMLTLWVRAAEAWENAVSAYPPGGGALAKLDKDRMAKRAKSCHASDAARMEDAATRTA